MGGVADPAFRAELLAPDIRKLPGWVLISVNLFLALVAAAALLGLWTHRQG